MCITVVEFLFLIKFSSTSVNSGTKFDTMQHSTTGNYSTFKMLFTFRI